VWSIPSNQLNQHQVPAWPQNSRHLFQDIVLISGRNVLHNRDGRDELKRTVSERKSLSLRGNHRTSKSPGNSESQHILRGIQSDRTELYLQIAPQPAACPATNVKNETTRLELAAFKPSAPRFLL
jgi:hypothetical protein